MSILSFFVPPPPCPPGIGAGAGAGTGAGAGIGTVAFGIPAVASSTEMTGVSRTTNAPQIFRTARAKSAFGNPDPGKEKYDPRSAPWYDGVTEYWYFQAWRPPVLNDSESHCAGQSYVVSAPMLIAACLRPVASPDLVSAVGPANPSVSYRKSSSSTGGAAPIR